MSNIKTILLLDDDEDDLHIFNLAFEEQNSPHLLVQFNKINDFLIYLDSQNVADLIIMDWQINDTIGDELLQKIKGNSKFSTTPVVVLSGSSVQLVEEQILKLGASCYFEKPSSFRQSVQMVKEILNSYCVE